MNMTLIKIKPDNMNDKDCNTFEMYSFLVNNFRSILIPVIQLGLFNYFFFVTHDTRILF